jgi:transposase
MAHVARGVSTLATGIWIFPPLAAGWYLGSRHANTARGSAAQGGAEDDSLCGNRGFAVGQDRVKRGQRGFDAGKKIKGRKQHIAVDTMGLVLAVVVHSAGIQDRVGARAVLVRLFASMDTIQTVFVDGGYSGKLIDWSKEMFGWLITVVKRTEAHKFEVLPKRWIVERTLAWLTNSRRLVRDYEVSPKQAEAMIKVAMIHLMLKRLA